MSRIWRLFSIPVLIANVVGCHADSARSGEGRLDLVVRPDTAAASGRPLHGSFVLRSLERADSQRVTLESPHQTLSVPLAAGAYLLDWQPQISFPARSDALSPALEASAAASAPRQPIVISPGRVTTLNVRARLGSSTDADRDTLAAEEAAVEIRIARH